MSGQIGQAPDEAQNAAFLHSDSAFKIIQKGTGTLTGTDNSASGLWTLSNTSTITHNLGFKPIHMVYYDFDLGTSTKRMAPGSVNFNASFAFPWETYLIADVTATLLNVRLYTKPNSNSSSLTVNYTYYILQETL